MFLLTSCNVIKKGFKFKLNGKNSLNLQLGLVLNHAVSSFKWDQFHLFNNELCRQVDSLKFLIVSHCTILCRVLQAPVVLLMLMYQVIWYILVYKWSLRIFVSVHYLLTLWVPMNFLLYCCLFYVISKLECRVLRGFDVITIFGDYIDLLRKKSSL